MRAVALLNWVRQDRIDKGEISGLTSRESAELARAKRRIRELELELELELEVEIHRRTSKILGADLSDPIGFTR
jgi:transposase